MPGIVTAYDPLSIAPGDVVTRDADRNTFSARPMMVIGSSAFKLTCCGCKRARGRPRVDRRADGGAFSGVVRIRPLLATSSV